MNQRQILVLAALKRCHQFLRTYGRFLRGVEVSPPGRELKDTISIIEHCADKQMPGLKTALPLAIHHGRVVRRNLDDLVRPIVRRYPALGDTWRRVKTIEAASQR